MNSLFFFSGCGTTPRTPVAQLAPFNAPFLSKCGFIGGRHRMHTRHMHGIFIIYYFFFILYSLKQKPTRYFRWVFILECQFVKCFAVAVYKILEEKPDFRYIKGIEGGFGGLFC